MLVKAPAAKCSDSPTMVIKILYTLPRWGAAFGKVCHDHEALLLECQEKAQHQIADPDHVLRYCCMAVVHVVVRALLTSALPL